MSKIIETTNKAVEEAYSNVKAKFNTSGNPDIISYWLSVREDYHYLGEAEFDALNRKVISENGHKINS